MKPGLHLRAGQSLAMTPALQHAIRLLQLSSLDLQQEIRDAVESNLMLEFEEDAPPEAPAEGSESTEDREGADATEASAEADVEIDWDANWDAEPRSAAASDPDLDDYRQASLTGGTSLHDHLAWQASLAPFTPLQAQVAAHLIDAINDDGYLEDYEGVCARLAQDPGAGADEVAGVLAALQDFDPPGVGARDLAECLTLQLRQLDAGTPVRDAALRAVAEEMPLLARRDAAALGAALGLDADGGAAVLDLIHTLQPHPGRPYVDHEATYVAPDVYVAKREGKWRVSLNPDITPRVRLNAQYVGLVKRADQSPDQVTLKRHLQEARYLLSSLEARNDTLLRVSQCIVEEQRAFLDYGDEAMRPLVLRDVADRLGVHESTVSRATANKYMLTPRGLYELKHFFSSHVSTVQGGTASATAIQAMIKRLVAEEPPHRPLSDSTLAKLLLKEGIQVARRTVAKYREALGIPASHERKAVA